MSLPDNPPDQRRYQRRLLRDSLEAQETFRDKKRAQWQAALERWLKPRIPVKDAESSSRTDFKS